MQIMFDPENSVDRKVIREVLDRLEMPLKTEQSTSGGEADNGTRLTRGHRRRKNGWKRWTASDNQFITDHAGRWYAERIARTLCRTTP